ncbi:MAG: 2OG-Fe(II) oxygenase [Pseudomonadota bacterium]
MTNAATQSLPKVICTSPALYLLENFLSHEECDHFIRIAEKQIAPSVVVDENSGQYVAHKDRTSRGTHFLKNQDPVIAAVEQRTALYSNTPIENGENIQILHYGIGAEYKPHFDYFDPVLPGSAEVLKRGGQRICTFVMYLNDVEEGGETIFPVPNVKVTPRKGDAAFFWDVTADGKIDPNSLHGGAPVIKGEKWIATRWIRERAFY